MGSITPLLKDNKMAKPDWITVNPSSGEGTGSFNVTCAENTSTSARSGVITVRTLGGLTREIQVSQAGKVANYIQGSGVFCGIGLNASVYPAGVSQVTFCVQIILSDGTQIQAGTVTLTKNESEGISTGELSLDSEKIAVNNGVTVKEIGITCNPGSTPWATPFNRCVGTLDNNPENLAFGTSTSSTTHPATFRQFTHAACGFVISNPVPISGDTTFVYKGNLYNIPVIIINELR